LDPGSGISVRRDVGKEEIPAICDPDRAFRPDKAFGQQFEFSVRRYQVVDRRIEALDIAECRIRRRVRYDILVGGERRGRGRDVCAWRARLGEQYRSQRCDLFRF
jgi:hypothetical protein